MTTKVAVRKDRIRRSSLWAAYGDALGWISELTDAAGLRRRTGGAPLCEPVEWKRRVGGRAGIMATLPAGCYSDDTQLRLATGRAIRPDSFDVEAFAKVELPVWLGYALGAGKSTSAAALNLSKPRASWFANTFKGWTESGGNGAAMRIQPHVWAARSLEVHAGEVVSDPKRLPEAPASSVARDPQPGEPGGQQTDSKRMPDQTVSEPVPEMASGSKPLDLHSAVKYVTEHRDDDGKIGKALRKVVNEGTPDEVAGFTAALVALIRQPK